MTQRWIKHNGGGMPDGITNNIPIDIITPRHKARIFAEDGHWDWEDKNDDKWNILEYRIYEPPIVDKLGSALEVANEALEYYKTWKSYTYNGVYMEDVPYNKQKAINALEEINKIME